MLVQFRWWQAVSANSARRRRIAGIVNAAGFTRGPFLMDTLSGSGGRPPARRPHSLDRALKLLTFLVGQCHDDRIFIDANELGRLVVGIAED